MAKGKFTHSHKDGDSDIVRKFSRALQEDETVILPEPTENPLDTHEESDNQDERRSMPEYDFEDFSDLSFLKDLNIPELSALDTDSEDSGFKARFEPIPPSHDPTEDEKIEQAFEKTAERKKKRRIGPGFWARSGKKLLVSLICIVVLLFLGISGYAVYGHFSDPYDHKILNGVYVAGVNLGSMTRKQAEEAVEIAADRLFSRQDMVIRLPDQTITLSPAATKISLRAGAAVKKAYSYGREGSRQEQEEAFRNSLSGTYEVDLLPYLEADETYIRKQLQGYADAHSSSYTPSSYALEGEQPPLDFENFNEKNTPQTLLLILGNPGFHLDADNALRQIMEAYADLNMAPDIGLESGDQAPEALDLNRIFEEYNIEPVNSSMDPEDFDVISGSYGYTFDLQDARRQLTQAHYGDTIRIPMEYVAPDILDHEVFFQDVLSYAETPHGKNKKRNVNLSLACKALDGLVLNPGDEFSYNAALGQRTADKGYQAAPAYSGDTLVDSLGGGICQVSSTLYLSCMLADLEITDRINHGFLASYIDPGMDATVSWEKPDFKFRNNSDYPIKISAEATEDKVIVRILGTDDKDYYVKMEYEMSDVLPNEIYEEYSPDSGYYDGQVVKEGTLGHYVKTYRCKYSKKTNVLISREFEARSSYMTRDRVVAVVKPKPTESTAPEVTEPEVPTPTKPSETTPPSEPESAVPPETTAPPADAEAPQADPPAQNESGETPESSAP